MTISYTRQRRWRRVEYERLVELGVFGPDERVELLDGVLVVREPQGAPHMAAIRATEETLRVAFGPGWDVRVQGPIALDDDSEPEPDVAVVPGSYRDYRRAHPSRAVLVVEVADSTLVTDRRKASLYARAGVPEYWIVNLIDDVLEVYRDPVASETAPHGWMYEHVARLQPGETMSPLAEPTGRVNVVDLF